MLVKLNDKNDYVSEIQKLLSLIGYDLIIDGSFGLKTERSVKSFQKKSGLKEDGVVGDITFEALKASQKRNSKESKTVLDSHVYPIKVVERTLSTNQYIKQTFDKTQIFLHFTAGGPNAENVISGWNADEPAISTAYIVDRRDGTVFECFKPEFWSYHLGIKGTKGKLDKSSIGIEICNWGPITKKGDKFFTYVNREISEDNVFKLDTPFRGFSFYEKFTDAQIDNVENMLRFLINKFNIKVQPSFDMSWFDYKQDVIDKSLPGIWTHVNVRQDKNDLYPDPKIIEMLNRIAKEFNS